MAKTKAQLRNRALEMLGEIAIGQTPAADIANDMEDAYDQVYARLERRGLVTWSSTDSIPDEFVEDISVLMAFERAENIPQEKFARLAGMRARAVQSISDVIAGRWTNPREYSDF